MNYHVESEVYCLGIGYLPSMLTLPFVTCNIPLGAHLLCWTNMYNEDSHKYKLLRKIKSFISLNILLVNQNPSLLNKERT